MLSDSWLKDKHPCLVFVKVHITDKGCLRRRRMIKTKNQMTLITKVYIQVDDSSEESEHESEHSCHNPSHMMST